MPHLIKSSGVQDMLWVGVLSALPYAVACMGMVLLTRRSDRTGERKRYLVYCLLAAAIGYLLACLYADSSLAMMAALVLATAVPSLHPDLLDHPPIDLLGLGNCHRHCCNQLGRAAKWHRRTGDGGQDQ